MSTTRNDAIESSEKIKRPMNAFILWSRERRRELANDDPNMHNFEISKRLGIEWNRLDAKLKKHFYDEAQKLKEEHRKNYPDYKYHPRRKPRRRLSPINPLPPYRMASYLPFDKVNMSFGTGYYHRVPWYNKNLLPSVPGADTAYHLPTMRYYPQSHMIVNPCVPAGYYSLPDVTSSNMEGEGQIMEMLSRYGSSELMMSREQLLHRATYGTQGSCTNGKQGTENNGTLEMNKHSGYHRNMSSTHGVCPGCQGGVTMYYDGTCSTQHPQT